MDIEEFLSKNYLCYDRFTFDIIFRKLLMNDYSHEEAKDIILNNCSLSSLVLQERIYNSYYKRINIEEKISADLLKLKNEIFNQKMPKYFFN
ncbi:MAG: hypothetical protein RBR87_10090 [Bacteroidales bacterium]|jgi:hypothetical protein|nr:hypothetical protein [Bacteroidales bacterium]